VRKKITKESTESNISTKCSKAYVNSKTIQEGLFDWTIIVNKTYVEKVNLILKNENIEDYYRAIAITAILSDRITDLIDGKR